MHNPNSKNYRLYIKNLFLRQSCLDSWDAYREGLAEEEGAYWDYIILTASNEEQAKAYRMQIERRLERGLLPEKTEYAVLPDPGGKRVGSGGATLHALDYIARKAGGRTENPFAGKRILAIHSGGDSKRVPQYSALGKLFSPVPRRLPDGRPSTLFDEILISMSGVAGRLQDGMLVLSGDVLLLFNPLQIDFGFRGAAALSVKADAHTGRDHGVFLNDGNDFVGRFLHKQPEEKLRRLGAVNDRGFVDLDTGAAALDASLLGALYGLISTNGQPDDKKYAEFINDKARISFYGDFLYPLAANATLEGYFGEAPEGDYCPELMECRRKIWAALSLFRMKLISLSPAEFLHFGTTSQLHELMTQGVEDYSFLGWEKQVCAAISRGAGTAVYNSLISDSAVIGEHTYLEHCEIGEGSVIGKGCILSGISARHINTPGHVVMHGLCIGGENRGFVVRIYGIEDNPKEIWGKSAVFLGANRKEVFERQGISPEMLWEDGETSLWNARLYPLCASMEEAVRSALALYRIVMGEASKEETEAWKGAERMSLCSSFNRADIPALLGHQSDLEDKIPAECFIRQLREGVCIRDALGVFGNSGITEAQRSLLRERACGEGFSTALRITYALGDEAESFEMIRRAVLKSCLRESESLPSPRIRRERVDVELPVRVNWGGGWTDTPPYCLEHGGVVLNAAVKLNGIYPVSVTVRRLPEYIVSFESVDVGAQGAAKSVEEIRSCRNPYDLFALHKAALIACGIIPLSGEAELEPILRGLGGGICLTTQVRGVPKGSGLGTSSILAGACVKAIFEFLGGELPDAMLYDMVLCMEQIMSTGGGWQDQVGGMKKGIKFITSRPGIRQRIHTEQVQVPKEAMEELEQRFALIYTGQRRLARNLLREVVGNYISGRRETLHALFEMQRIAALMKFELERGNIDELAKLFNRHWQVSKELDQGSTNTCIEQIFLACEDLIDGRFIAGAGGGGFLQVILKKGVSRRQLDLRLKDVFQDTGVGVWECEFV